MAKFKAVGVAVAQTRGQFMKPEEMDIFAIGSRYRATTVNT
jgi:hypothetical protein